MILVLKQSHHGSTELTPAITESTGVLPGLSPVAGKPVHAAFDGGRLTSDAGILLLAEIGRRLGVCERLARCIEEWSAHRAAMGAATLDMRVLAKGTPKELRGALFASPTAQNIVPPGWRKVLRLLLTLERGRKFGR